MNQVFFSIVCILLTSSEGLSLKLSSIFIPYMFLSIWNFIHTAFPFLWKSLQTKKWNKYSKENNFILLENR